MTIKVVNLDIFTYEIFGIYCKLKAMYKADLKAKYSTFEKLRADGVCASVSNVMVISKQDRSGDMCAVYQNSSSP